MAGDAPDAPTVPAAPPPPCGRSPVRSAAAVVLIVLAALLAPLAVLAVWANAEVTDTDRYVATMAPLADDPAVQAAVTDRVTAAVVDRLPPSGSLIPGLGTEDGGLLDGLLGQLGPALEEGVTQLVHDGVQGFVRSDAFAAVWTQVNRDAHAGLDEALDGRRGGPIEITGDTVTLDLAPVVDLVKARLVADGLDVAASIPAVDATYTLVTSDRVGEARDAVRMLALADVWLPLLTVACAAGGVLAALRRRRALVAAALAVTATTALLGLGIGVLRPVYLDRLAAGTDRDAAAAVYDAVVRHLRETVAAVLVLGVLVALGAWLGGPYRGAGTLRGGWRRAVGGVRTAAGRAGLRPGPAGRFVHRFKAWLYGAAVAGAVAVLLLWDYPTAAVVACTGAVLLGVVTLVELLDDPGPGGTRTAVRP